jgi:GAF domain-containing protein
LTEVLAVGNDVTEQKRAQQERETTIQFLRLVNESKETRDLIQKATSFFQQQSGCQAVGIRLRDGDDFPYYETRGFPPEFVLAENRLCTLDAHSQVVREDAGNPLIECMCGNVICGRFDPSKPFFTTHGSFWTNSTTELLASTTEVDRQARTRNRCNGEGYESVALLPLRLGEQRFGLLQLNDRRKGMFSPETIVLWERFADYLAAALAKLLGDEALRESEERFHSTLDNMLEGCQIIGFDWRYLYLNAAAARLKVQAIRSNGQQPRLYVYFPLPLAAAIDMKR